MGYWWDIDRETEIVNQRRLVRKARLQRPQEAPLTLIVLGDFAHFKSSALSKAIGRRDTFRVLAFAEADDAHLGAELTRLIRWAPRSLYRISARERARIPPGVLVINDTGFDCAKDNVQRVFAETMGYTSAVDPQSHQGPAIMKSKLNARHDGRLVQLPASLVQQNSVYEILVDNVLDDAFVFDIRLVMTGFEPVLAYLKIRRRERRFENINLIAKLLRPSDLLTFGEIAACSRFCRRIGLEFGEIDVIRDCESGRIFVVDANNTAHGPSGQLSLSEREMAFGLIADSVSRAFFGRQA